MDAVARDLLQHAQDRLLATQDQKAAMAEIVIGCPFQDGNGIAVADQLAQPFAGLVPVDQENQP